jgi:hypothetical protein
MINKDEENSQVRVRTDSKRKTNEEIRECIQVQYNKNKILSFHM